jgi:methionyl-tRNA formyltransferase
MKSASEITVSLFTAGTHTQPLIKALKAAKNIHLANLYPRLPSFQQLAKDKADVFLVADFGQIVPKELFSLPPHGWLVIHPSLLPQYRGASPVQAAIANGDQETGASIIQIHQKVDYGPIVAQLKEPIKANDTAGSLYQRLFGASGEILVTILPAWVKGKIKPRVQDHSKATYTARLTRDDGRIDWQKSAQANERFIRAMSPWPGAWTMIKKDGKEKRERRLKIIQVHLEKNKLVLDQVQLEGKKPVTGKQFQEGYPKAKFIS